MSDSSKQALEKKLTRSEQKRLDIINAAKKAFNDYGVQGTSMDKLAEVAGVSKRTVYNHFASKEALVMYLVGDLWRQALVHSEQTYCDKTELNTQLGEIILSEVQLIGSQTYIELSRVAFGYLLFNAELLKHALEEFANTETALFKWLKAAVADGKLVIDDIELANTQIHNLIKGSCFWPQLMQISPVLNSKEQGALVDSTVTMFLSRYQS